MEDIGKGYNNYPIFCEVADMQKTFLVSRLSVQWQWSYDIDVHTEALTIRLKDYKQHDAFSIFGCIYLTQTYV